MFLLRVIKILVVNLRFVNRPYSLNLACLKFILNSQEFRKIKVISLLNNVNTSLLTESSHRIIDFYCTHYN